MRNICLFVLMASMRVLGQPVPDVAGILKQVATAYSAAKDYEVVAEQTQPGMKMRIHMAFQAPNRFRFDQTRVDLDPPLLAFRAVLYASGMWAYLGETGTYAFMASNELPADQLQSLRSQAPLALFRSADKYTGGAKLLREEATEIEGIKIDCYVVSIPLPDGEKATWWIAKQSAHVIRQDGRDVSTVFTTVKLNEQPPEGLFQVNAPPGARKFDP